MTARLLRDEIAHHLAALQQRSTLTALQSARLAAILDTLADDGRFLLRAALDAAEFPAGDARGQEAFQDFRKRVNHAAAQAGVDLRLELDSRKAPPDQRHGWFTGGDLVDAGIASFTGQAAGRTGIDHPVTPEVAELGRSRRTRVYVSVAPTDTVMARKVGVLLRQLREALALDRERSWEVADSGSVGLGEDPEAVRDRLCAQADLRLVLVSPGYLVDAAPERARTLDSPGRVVAFALSGLPDGPLDLGPLRRHDVRRRMEPWDELTRTDQRRRYVADVVDEIRRALRPSRVTAEDRTPDEPLTQWSASLARSRRAGDSAVLIEPESAETTLRESRLDRSGSAHGPALPAVARLVDWARAEETGAPRLCALLGDVGMGKTTTAKLFTQRLLELRAGGTRCPLPILFDLRDVRITSLAATMTLDHILDGMLNANRPASVPRDRLSAEVVRRRLGQGDAVVVFDGLDEVLVHLSPHDQQLFTRQLWRALGEGSGAKMLLTCRTQYFRTIREEITYFTGEGRAGLRGEDYLALLMLPFREEQVREYLTANLDRDAGWVDGFLDTIAAVHDLPDLARRPLTLRLIADQVEFIETAKLAGRTLRSVDLYGEVVERWLSRDSGKHTFTPEHKQLLMENIAAELWRSGRNSWEAAEVDSWLLDVLDLRPDLQRHYRERVPDLWKADFRTATFLTREDDGDTFAFGHRSLAEYFLARHLLRTLIEAGSTTGRGLDALAIPVPSPETLDFLGQSIAAAPAEHRSAALAGLDRIRRRYLPQASELALAYALRAADHGHPHQSLVGLRLAGARLSGWAIGTQGHDDTRLPMTGADLTGADLRRATLHRVDLTRADLSGADLTCAELHSSRLTSARFDGARAIGTIVRECALDGTEIARAATYRTQILRCTPAPQPAPGLLIAPLPGGGQQAARDVSPLRPLTGNTGGVWAVAWSPDGTRLLTGGYGGAQVWDAATAEPLHRLTGHTGGVWAVAWSPDGTRLLTGGEDSTVRVWDAATAEPLHQLTGHTGGVWAVAWSPDGTRLLTGGDGGARIWDTATAEPLHQLTGHTGGVWAVAWSPDGTRLLTGGEDSTVRVWDAATAEPLHQLTGGVQAVAWSPDGTRLLTGGDGDARIWDAATAEPLHQLTGHTGRVQAVAWSPDGTRLLTGGYGDARIWDAATAEPLHQLTGHTGRVQAVAWSPDGTRLLTGGVASTVRVWDAATAEPLHQLTGHTDWMQGVAWSPDGTRLLTGGYGGARVWDAATAEPLHQLTGHTGGVWAVAWSPDGTRLLTGGDGARVWDAATAEPLHQLTGHTGTGSVGGGLVPRRHPPAHRWRRRAGLGCRHRRTPAPAHRPHRRSVGGGLVPRRHPPAHRWRRRAGLGCRHRRTPAPAHRRGTGGGLVPRRHPPAHRWRRRAGLGCRHRRTPAPAHRPHRPSAGGGLVPRRHPPTHRRRRQHCPGLGRRHRRTFAPAHRPHRLGTGGGLVPRRHPPTHRQRRQHRPDLGRHQRAASRVHDRHPARGRARGLRRHHG